MTVLNRLTMIVALAGFSLALAAAGESTEPQGSEVALKGMRTELSGHLLQDDGEWYLVTAGQRYEIHFGLLGETADAVLVSGQPVSIDGFLLGSHLAPIALQMGSVRLAVWTEERRPVWSGQGRGRNATGDAHTAGGDN